MTALDVSLDDLDVRLDGAAVLDDVETFLRRFVVYPDDTAAIAHTLWIAHTWLMDRWDSTPRIAFLSPEPGSGKSRALEVTEPLVPRPVHAVNTTPSYLFRKVSDEAGPPTLLYDEVDTVFGPRAKDNEDIRGMLNAGHRRGATAGRCVVRGKTVDTEELPAYCAVALAGLDDLPDTIATRSVIVRMRRRSAGERVEPWRLRINGAEALKLRDRIAGWAASVADHIAWPDFPPGVEDRAADVWEALLSVADAAGQDWPERARVAAVTSVTQSQAAPASLGVLLLDHLRTHFLIPGGGISRTMSTAAVIDGLTAMEEAPWADLRGKPLDARGLAKRLAKYGVTPKVFRDGDTTARGYDSADLADAWDRYLPPLQPDEGVTAVTSETAQVSGAPHPQHDPQQRPPGSATAPHCASCGRELDAVLAARGETTHVACTPAGVTDDCS